MSNDSLFVKIDGYKDILREIESIRILLSNLTEAISVLKKVSEVKEKSISTFIENMDRVGEKILAIEKEFPNIQIYEPQKQIMGEKTQQPVPSQDERDLVESSVKALHGELESLRNELSNLK